MSGFLISFDGLDSSGKNTQTQALIARLRKAGRRVATFTTPDYTTPSGQELRARLQGKVGDWATTPWQEKMRLFAKNRAEHRQEVVDALSVGAIVLYDRYVPSSLAFIAVEAALQDPTVTREQVYGAVNEWMPGLIDECLKKRTILCGPWTLYAILRIIWQAWQNYNYSLAIRDIIKSINGFLQDYGKFKERFTELGDRLSKVSEKYQEISATSYKRLDQRLQQIEGYRKGHQIPEETAEPEAPLPSVPALTKQESG